MTRHFETLRERTSINGQPLTPPAKFFNGEKIDSIQSNLRRLIEQELPEAAGLLASKKSQKLSNAQLSRIANAAIVYKTDRKRGQANDTYSTVPGIKIYTTSSGLLHITDPYESPESSIFRDNFKKIEHNAWLLELPNGIFAEGGIRGNMGEEMTISRTRHHKIPPETYGHFTIPFVDIYRIEGTAEKNPDLWQNRSYTWDFKSRK